MTRNLHTKKNKAIRSVRTILKLIQKFSLFEYPKLNSEN